MMRGVLLSLLLVLLAVRAASAQGVVVESYVGERPDDASDALRGLFQALATHGAVAGDELRDRIEASVSRPARMVTDEHLATAARLVDQAEKLAAGGRHAEAIRVLPTALDVYAAQAGAVAASTDLRLHAHRAHVALVAAHLAVGNRDEARATAAELMRAFPDQAIAAPAVEKLAAEVRAGAKGSARVEAGDPAADIFLDERKIGTGTAAAADLVPGTYRVHAQRQGVAGRVHQLEVVAGGTAELNIDWELDSTLRSTKDFVGFRFASDADRLAREVSLARALARALGAREVVIVGIRTEGGTRSIIAAALDVASGTPLLAAAAAIEPLSTLDIRAAGIADYLAGKPAIAGVVPLSELAGAGKTTAVVIDPATQPTSRVPLYKWSALGLGTAALAGGITLLVIDGTGTCTPVMGQTQCPELYDTKLLGLATLAGSAALLGTGIYLWLRGAPTPERRRIGLAPTPGGAAFVFTTPF